MRQGGACLLHHFCAAAFDLEGKAWYGNKTTLKRCRQVSDDLCRAHGLSVIEQPKKIRSSKYGEWLARQTGTSWKQKLCDGIDRLILREDILSVEDLAAALREQGYTATLKKYLSIKAEKNRRAIRSYRLGDGYAVEELRYRIKNKDREMSIAAVAGYQGIQREYALCLRELQIMVYRREEKNSNAAYAELRKNTELLCYLHDHDIRSGDDFEKHLNAAAEKSDSLKKTVSDMREKIMSLEKISEHGDRYVELNNMSFPTAEMLAELESLDYLSEYGLLTFDDVESCRQKLVRLKAELPKVQEQLAAAENEKREAAEHYRNYIRQMESDFDFIREKIKSEQEKIEKAEREIQRERAEENRKHTRNDYYM